MSLRMAGSCFMAAALLAGCAASPPARGGPAVADFGTTEESTPPAGRAASRFAMPISNPWQAGARCADRWNCTMHADPTSFRYELDAAAAAAGRQALCIERVKPEPWALITQAVDHEPLRGTRLRLSAAVRTPGIDGRGAGPWVLVQGAQGPIGHFEKLVTKTAGWERVAVEFTVAPTAMVVEIGATLEGGGRACLDDFRLEVLQEKAP